MKLATTTGDFGFLKDYEKQIKHIHDAGFRYIDLNIYSEHETERFMKPDWKEYALSLKAYAENSGMKFVQAHSPDFMSLMKKGGFEEAVLKTIRSIEVCGVMGIPSTVVHSLHEEKISKAEFFEKNREVYKLFYSAMEENNVNVLIENSTKANMGDRYFFLTGKDMKEFIDYCGHPLLHACWDTGHANVEGHQFEDIADLGEDLYALHINDNRGIADEHLMPYLGTFSLDEIMEALKNIGYNRYFTFEAGSSIIKGNTGWLYPKKQYKNSEKLLNPPLFMHDDLEKLLYKTGEYILKAYDCFEE